MTKYPTKATEGKRYAFLCLLACLLVFLFTCLLVCLLAWITNRLANLIACLRACVHACFLACFCSQIKEIQTIMGGKPWQQEHETLYHWIHVRKQRDESWCLVCYLLSLQLDTQAREVVPLSFRVGLPILKANLKTPRHVCRFVSR